VRSSTIADGFLAIIEGQTLEVLIDARNTKTKELSTHVNQDAVIAFDTA
jgi:hypothetical protein